jgi:hypothetical protein
MNIPETYDYLVHARRDLWALATTTASSSVERSVAQGKRILQENQDCGFGRQDVRVAYFLHISLLRA